MPNNERRGFRRFLPHLIVLAGLIVLAVILVIEGFKTLSKQGKKAQA